MTKLVGDQGRLHFQEGLRLRLSVHPHLGLSPERTALKLWELDIITHLVPVPPRSKRKSSSTVTNRITPDEPRERGTIAATSRNPRGRRYCRMPKSLVT